MITLNYRPLACKARTTLISRVVGSWTHTTSTEPLGVKDKKPAIQTFRGRDWWNVFSYQGIDRRTTICTTQRRIWTAFHVRKAKPPFSFEASSFYWRLVDINLDLSESDVECVLLFATAMAESSSEKAPVTRSKLFVLVCVREGWRYVVSCVIRSDGDMCVCVCVHVVKLSLCCSKKSCLTIFNS